ncbi:unnamed protein product, partial [Hapterophycus canaliculatus]
HHHTHNGFAGQRDSHQSGRDSGSGSGGGQGEPNTPNSNRKGHDEEQTLIGGVGKLVKRARRGVNSYLSALARQQKEIARQQRERARKKSSNFDFLVDAEEGVGLLAMAGGGDAAGAGVGTGRPEATNGTPLHRSKSAVFVPPRPVQQVDTPIATAVLETRSTGVVSDAVELQEVIETEAYVRRGDMGYGIEGGVEATPGALARGVSMTRGGRAGMTTGDLIRLYREEEQGAGEDSAQDEDRERLGAPQKVGLHALGRSRWRLRPRKAVETAPMPDPKDRKSSVEQWKRYRDQWNDHGFKVLGVEIGHLPEHQQVALLAGGVFFFLLIYGYMQEYLVVKIFNREFGLFMTFLQFFGYAACAALRRGIHRETGRKIPLRTYFGLGFLQAVMQGLTNVSMMYLNYPAKVLFKSSRMVPIMCFGVVWQGRKYSMRDCLVVCFIVVGLATFMNAETRSSAESDTPCSLLGVACISLALVIDAANINLQEEVMNRYLSCQDELIMFSYLCGTVYVASFCIISGELVSGFVFLQDKGLWAIGAVMMYCGAGFLGGSCAVALTKRFGALHSAITTTARKAVTLMLSFAYFQKAFTPQHLVGATVFMVGLMAKIFGKEKKPSAPAQRSADNSPAVTPFLNPSHRKHLDNREDPKQINSSSATTSLLSGGSGGGGCNEGGGYADVRTHSPSPVGNKDSAPITGNSDGNPVRHRGIPKPGSGVDGSGSESGSGGGRGGG